MGADHGRLRIKTQPGLIMRTAPGAVDFPGVSRAGLNRPAPAGDEPEAPALFDEFCLLERENVFRQRLGVIIADGPVRRHRDGTPYAGRALFDLLRQIGLGVLWGLVLARHLPVSGAAQFLFARVPAMRALFF